MVVGGGLRGWELGGGGEQERGGSGGGIGGLAPVLSACVETDSIPGVVQSKC